LTFIALTAQRQHKRRPIPLFGKEAEERSRQRESKEKRKAWRKRQLEIIAKAQQSKADHNFGQNTPLELARQLSKLSLYN
jgi:hypothetical protein